MNLYLHGIGIDPNLPPITIADSLALPPKNRVDMVMTNPPFGRKSVISVVSDGRDIEKDDIAYARSDFWATTKNKQLNFVQHVYSVLKNGGRAAMVVPDNVLFEGGAGEIIRRELIKRADVHTLLRLPVGIWYSTGVKANVLFFDRKRSRKKEVWIYDLRTNQNFTLRHRPLTSADLTDFVKCFGSRPGARRRESERFKRFSHKEILSSDKASLDIVWLADVSYDDPLNLPPHETLAKEVIALLKTAVSEFEAAIADAGPVVKKDNVSSKQRFNQST
jgi:type I restriction enzyme M protein